MEGKRKVNRDKATVLFTDHINGGAALVDVIVIGYVNNLLAFGMITNDSWANRLRAKRITMMITTTMTDSLL